jgi:hypothetical protein
VKRYVSVSRSAAGKTAVTVSLVDGSLSSKWTTETYTGSVDKATITAEKYARDNLQALKNGLDQIEEAGGNAA